MKKLLLSLLAVIASFSMYAQGIPESVVLKRLDNTEIKMKEVLNEDIVIITFWATWCKPCRTELDAIADVEEMWAGKVKIVAVNIDDSRAVSKVKSLVSGKKWPYEVLLDANKELYKILNLSAIPYAMILHKSEKVWEHSGYAPGDEVIMIEKALSLLVK